MLVRAITLFISLLAFDENARTCTRNAVLSNTRGVVSGGEEGRRLSSDRKHAPGGTVAEPATPEHAVRDD